ncbi:STAS domain-containing protein [Streptomyces sp. 1222.5]|uniref:STAS domain-containing protein n=1 Tax=Streptomyces sp. 1222.5 TaxID=1881026 RepID=UPI003EBA7563
MSGGGGITSLVSREDDAVLLGVFGELDAFTGPELCAVVTGCLAQRPARLVMDVSGVSFCDASGLTALLKAREGAVRAGACFVLTGVQPVLLRILAITHLDAGFGLRPPHGSTPHTGPAAA